MADRPELNDDFLDMLRALQGSGAEFLVVGAHAMAAHGVPRATGDLDLLVRPSEQNAARVVTALRAFGAPLAAHGVTPADFAQPGMVYQLGLPPRRIDLLTEISGVDFEQAWATRREIETQGLRLPVIGLSALIANKRATGRPKDAVDVELLERAAAARDEGRAES